MEQNERDVCLHDIKSNLEELKAVVLDLKKWQAEDDKKQALSEKDIETLRTGMDALVGELRETRTELKQDVHELKLLLAEDYVKREGFMKFSDKMVETLEKLSTKIDDGNKEMYKCIVEGDADVKNSIGRAFWKVVGTCIALGGVLVAALKALVDFVRTL
jgi:soluble cytochrome b562